MDFAVEFELAAGAVEIVAGVFRLEVDIAKEMVGEEAEAELVSFLANVRPYRDRIAGIGSEPRGRVGVNVVCSVGA